MSKSTSIIPSERIEQAILLFRGEKVMLDSDLALLYGVETKYLVRSVKRNASRFPEDFAFQLSTEEFETLRCQIGTSKTDTKADARGGRRYRPLAFTEHGIAMLSSVLHSPRAVTVNIEIMRAFGRLRKLLASHAELAKKLEDLEKRYDKQFAVVFDAIRKLMEAPPSPPREMGYHTLIRKGKRPE